MITDEHLIQQPSEFYFNNASADFTLQLQPLVLYKKGERVKIQLKALQVLSVLLHNSDRIVENEELINQVWAGNFYVGKQGIFRTMNMLRKALGDDAKNQKMIISYYGQGYRFFSQQPRQNDLSIKVGSLFNTLGKLWQKRKRFANGNVVVG
jgi:DNA-binding winged helix-turn-helix (wHTH) protein